MKKMIEKAYPEQVEMISQLLGENRYEYTLADVFNILPSKIRYRGKEGYLRISRFDIVYSSLETELKGEIVELFSFMLNKENVFDAFIAAIEFFRNHEEVVIWED